MMDRVVLDLATFVQLENQNQQQQDQSVLNVVSDIHENENRLNDNTMTEIDHMEFFNHEGNAFDNMSISDVLNGESQHLKEV